jgi:hypothetical protein
MKKNIKQIIRNINQKLLKYRERIHKERIVFHGGMNLEGGAPDDAAIEKLEKQKEEVEKLQQQKEGALEKKISESIEPLNAYLKTLKKYDAEYKLDPQSVISKLDDDENPPEAEAVRKDVIFHKKEAARLMIEIPDSIVVSMF